MMRNLHTYFCKTFLLVSLVLFVFSCGKKSDDPQPEPTPVTPVKPGTSTKQVPTNLKDSEPAAKGDGTVRTSPTAVTTTAGPVSVQDPSKAKVGDNGESANDLNQLLGLGNNLRKESSEGSNFAWFVTRVRVDGFEPVKSDAAGSDTMDVFNDVYFFEPDGYYYVWHSNKGDEGDNYSDIKNWDWGTWAIDDSLDYIAFDFDANNVPAEVWEIKALSKGYMALKTRDTIEGKPTDVYVSFEGYDFADENFGLNKFDKYDSVLTYNPSSVADNYWVLSGRTNNTGASISESQAGCSFSGTMLNFVYGKYLVTETGFLECDLMTTTDGQAYYDKVKNTDPNADYNFVLKIYYETLKVNGQVNTQYDVMVEVGVETTPNGLKFTIINLPPNAAYNGHISEFSKYVVPKP
jgi:hypothetical protein